MRSSYKTTGIVLRRANFGEADRVITFLTFDQGKVSAVAKGVRRIKSRMAGHLELFGTVEIMLATTKGLDVITSARLLRSADQILANYDHVSFGYLLAEMTDRLLEPGVSQPQLFDRLGEALEDLAAGGGGPVLELSYKLALLDALGYRPHLESCAVCHRPADSYYFVPSAGGIVDSNCTSDHSLLMESNQIKLWRLMLSAPLSQIKRITQAAEVARSSLPIINEFFDYTFGKRFRSQQFLASRP